MLIAAEAIMLVMGFYALIVGKLTLTKKLVLQGRRARVAGLFLIVPLPLAFLVGFLVGAGIIPAPGQVGAAIIEVLIVIGAFVATYIFARVTHAQAAATDEEQMQPSA